MPKMKILIACEYSGRVRDAFLSLGHDAISCDLLPTETPGPHYQGSVFDIINDGFDMMIAFPPCTDLSAAGVRHWPQKIADGRQAGAIEFVKSLYNSPIPKVCIENPQGALTKGFRRPDQTIQPHQFGDDYRKRTCLWLKNLPILMETHAKLENPREMVLTATGERWKNRSRTSIFIARAMAEQWG